MQGLRLGDDRPHCIAHGRNQDRACRHAGAPLHAARVPQTYRAAFGRELVSPRVAASRAARGLLLVAACRTAAHRARRRCRGRRLGQDAGAHRAGGRHDRDRPDPRVRHRVEHVEPGDRVRRRCRKRADPHEPSRRDAGPRGRDRRIPEPRGSRAARGLPRPGARFRRLSLRPAEAALHQAHGAAALPGRGAKIGTDIRVVGNDAGEQLSILAGTLARLDREAPEYGVGKYNDFNTFYIQAASGTSGGSSGSPVIDIRGRVVALNAGGSTGAASSFYLPLERVKRALDADPRRRAGHARHDPDRVRVHAVRRARPTGPAPARPRPRRARRRQNSPACWWYAKCSPARPPKRRCNRATSWCASTASSSRPSGRSTRCSTRRSARRSSSRCSAAGRCSNRSVAVQDLHAITPAEYLEFGDAVVHTLSYQMARHLNAPVRGVYVANPGYSLGAAGVPRGAVVTSVDGATSRPRGLRAGGLWPAARRPRDVALFHARRSQGLPRRDSCASTAAGSRRVTAAATTRPATGRAPTCPTPPPTQPRTRRARRSSPRATHVADRLAPSLVLVTFDMPFSVAGVTERNYHGTGAVVDAQRGPRRGRPQHRAGRRRRRAI